MRLIVARCEVRYSGRLDALLPEALRLLMVKADGSVLVHADAGGYKPLNWMTPPTVIEESPGLITVGAIRAQAARARTGSRSRSAEVLSDVDHEMGSPDERRRRWRRTASRRTCRSCWPSSRSGAARGSGSCGASGRPTSARST